MQLHNKLTLLCWCFEAVKYLLTRLLPPPFPNPSGTAAHILLPPQITQLRALSVAGAEPKEFVRLQLAKEGRIERKHQSMNVGKLVYESHCSTCRGAGAYAEPQKTYRDPIDAQIIPSAEKTDSSKSAVCAMSQRSSWVSSHPPKLQRWTKTIMWNSIGIFCHCHNKPIIRYLS